MLLLSLLLATVLVLPDAGGRKVIKVEPHNSERCEVSFRVPIADIQQLWTPDMITPYLGRKWWISKSSAPQSSMPCISYFNLAEKNRFFFGVETLEWDNLIESKINQELGVYDIRLTVAAGAGRKLKPFAVTIDRRDVIWTDAVDEWRKSLKYACGAYPSSAWEPAYCTWYAAHAAIDAKWVESTAAIAAELGFGTFILDDGWSYDESKRVNPDTIKTWYQDVGNWDMFSPVKFPNFRQHRECMRKFGLNYVVWVAPYFLGVRSKSFKEWGYDGGSGIEVVEGNALTDVENRTKMESVTAQLVRLMHDYELDGLKVDFLDYIKPSVIDPHGARAHEYVSDMMRRLREVRPNGVFEFRQDYATPITAALATQFRAGDVPFEWLDNIRRLAQIRLTMGDGVPVHSDPIYWSNSETDENIDRHFMAAMAGVPMLSIDLKQMSPSRREIVKKWIRFYNENVAQFHIKGKWRVFYRNGGFVGIASTIPGKAFAIVNEPAGFSAMRTVCEADDLITFNLGFEPLTLPNGKIVPPAGSACFKPKIDSHLRGRIPESGKYESLHPRFPKAFEFMRRPDLPSLPVGRYEIDGTNCWAIIMDTALRPFAATNQYEVHKAFIDIQSPISGPETIGVVESNPSMFGNFNYEKDFALFNSSGKPWNLVPGEFVVFFPDKGAHAPGLSVGSTNAIRKLVIKVRK